MIKEMKSIPHIAITSLAYVPFTGGAELAVQEIAARLPAAQFSCVTQRFDATWLAEEKIGNVRVVRVGRGKKSNHFYGRRREKFLYVFRAYRALKEIHARDPIHMLWAIMAAYGGIAALLFKLRHPAIPLLLTLQEGDSETHILRRVGMWYPFWRMLFRRADYIQVISSYLAAFARRQGARCPVEVVPNGVSLEKFIRDKRHAARTKRRKKEWIIITTSRLVQKNGIDILIRAFAKLKKLVPETAINPHTKGLHPRLSGVRVKLHIVGDGPEEAALKRLASSLGVGADVSFIGRVEPAWIPHHLRAADIFVRPSRSEGLGTSFLEAMAAGLPVVGTRVGGIPDFLKDPYDAGVGGATGLFAEAENPASVAEKIALLIKNPEVRKKIAAHGRKLVEHSCDWRAIASRMSRIFSFLIHPR